LSEWYNIVPFELYIFNSKRITARQINSLLNDRPKYAVKPRFETLSFLLQNFKRNAAQLNCKSIIKNEKRERGRERERKIKKKRKRRKEKRKIFMRTERRLHRQSANEKRSDGTALKLDFRSPRSIEFTQETVYAYGWPASIPKTLTIIQIAPINLLRPRAISPPDFRCKSALVCPLDDVYFRTIRPIKIIHHFQRAQTYRANVYVFTYESSEGGGEWRKIVMANTREI